MPDDNTELRQILVEGEPYFSKTKSALFASKLKTKKGSLKYGFIFQFKLYLSVHGSYAMGTLHIANIVIQLRISIKKFQK